jgi:cation diffusion facilitator family transporter
MGVNIFLTVVQIIGGILTHSQALIADAMHTLSDLVGDVVVLVASHHAAKAADANHPYGHGRIETLATVILGLLLSGVAVAISLHAWGSLTGNAPLLTPDPWAMGIAALAIIGKEGLYQYTVHVAKRIRSPMLKASAWHHRSDAISSMLVLVAIGGAQLGYPWLDSVAAIVVAAMIFYMAIQLILESTSELVDTGLDAQEVQDIREFICAIDGVESVHLLRTRRMGGRVLADAHLQVDGRISVSEGHHISDTVMYRLRRQFPAISDVIIHIDPEDDEMVHPSKNLPSRVELLAALHALPETAALGENIDDLTLHYQGGKLQLDVILRETPDTTALTGFKNACSSIPAIERIIFFTKIVH